MEKKKYRSRGGSRKGIPNKSTSDVRAVIDRVAKKHGGMDFVFKQLFELVKGVSVNVTDKKGEEHVYDKPPDPLAAKILLEYRYGKAPQPLVGNRENGEAISALEILVVRRDTQD
jgi:hypothetical protein